MTIAWLAVRQFLGGHVVLAGVCTALVVTALGWDSSRKARWTESGRQEVRASYQKNSDDNAKKADAARRDAERLPPGRLRDRHFRD
jgi:hypothetical protein